MEKISIRRLVKKLMTYCRFVLLLLQKGSLKSTKIDYELRRTESLADLPADVLPIRANHKKGLLVNLRSSLLKSNSLKHIIANLTYLKNPKKTYVRLFIHEEHELIYIRIFKCGSTSILRSLLPKIHEPLSKYRLSDNQIDSLSHHFEKNNLPASSSKYRSFAVVRNPLERVVSAYIDIFENGDYDNFLFHIFKRKMTFKEVLEILYIIPDHLRGPHFASQSTIINSTGIKKVQIFKLKEETIDLADFLDEFNLTLFHSNKSPKDINYKRFFSLETLELTHNIYKIDFTTFEYEESYLKILNLLKTN